MNGLAKKAEDELFSFFPKETTDKERIAEILAPIYTADTPKGKHSKSPLYVEMKMHDSRSESARVGRLTVLGKEMVKTLAVKATEFPFLRIFHYYKRRKERRRILEEFGKLSDSSVYPSADADTMRNRYKDVWHDDSFFALLEDLHGEVAATCKIVPCPECKGTGSEYYSIQEEDDIWMTCPDCKGRGKMGIYICKRCNGHGRVSGTRTTTRKKKRACAKCGGEGKCKSVLKAFLKVEDRSVDSDYSQKLKEEIRTGKAEEIRLIQMLQHVPKLCSELFASDFNWSRLKDDESRKAAQIKKIQEISVKGGVIDPKENDLSKLPLANRDDIKRVYDECYQQERSAFFVQNNTSNPNVHTICSDEEITILTGIGWVRIELKWGEEIWINTLTKEIREIPLKWILSDEYPDDERFKCPALVSNAIKEAKKRLPKLPKGKNASCSESSKKRWKFVVLGLLFGFLGIHLAYAKRWFLFLLLWAAFITGGVMSGGKGEPGKPAGDVETPQIAESADSPKNDGGSPIGGIGFAVWGLLWIGGTLFIKKDGKGNRM